MGAINHNITDLLSQAKRVRQIIIEQSKRANVGHIGSALSIVDILVTIYEGVIKIPEPSSQDRDRFVLSKGHAALALYAILHLKNYVSQAELDGYCQNNSQLGVHPEHRLAGVDFCTGSLGMGLSMGAGAALGAKIQKSARNVFVVMSDAELNEGSVWEAAMFAAHHRLHNLINIVDVNGQQALGFTEQVLSTLPLAERWQAFGWQVFEVDGHDIGEILTALTSAMSQTSLKPTVILANTQLGHGVSFMQRQIKWHYLPLNDAQYQQALSEVSK